jgi:exonuclease SbcC
MRVRTLRIRNIRRIRDATIEFGDGIVAVIGENGAGKTTVIESMFWALFGSDAGETLRGDKGSLRSDSAQISDSVQVSLEFEMEGRPYTVERSMNPKGVVDAKLSSGGILLAKGNDDVTGKIRSTLGMDWASFRKSVYSPQKELDALSDMQPNKRKEFISRLLGIDAIDKVVIPSIRKRASDAEHEMRSLQAQLQERSEIEIRSDLDALKKKMDGIERSRSERSSKLEGSEKLHSSLKNELVALDRRRGEHERTTRAIIETNGRAGALDAVVQTLKKRLAEIERAEQELRVMDGVEAEHDLTEERIEALENARESQQAMLELQRSIGERENDVKDRSEKIKSHAELEHEVDGLEELRSKLESERDACEVERKKLFSELNECRKRKEDIKRHMEQVKKLGRDGECPTCGRRLDDHYERLMEGYRKDIDEMDERIKNAEVAEMEVEAQASDIKKRGDALKKKEESINKKGWELQQLKKEIRVLQSDMDGKKARLKKLTDERSLKGLPAFEQGELDGLKVKMKALKEKYVQVKTLRKVCSEGPRIDRELRSKEAERGKLNGELERLQASLKEIDFDPAEHESLGKRVESNQELLGNLRKELHELEKDAIVNKKEIELLEKELRRQASFKEKVDSLGRELELVRALEQQMVLFWQYLMSRLRPSISDYTSSLLSEVSDYSRVELDDGYNLLVYREGAPRPIREFSGGEQDLMNLCLRLALSRIICERKSSEINLIILDEVFGSLDDSRRTALLTALNSISTKFSQVILITHVDDVKESVGSHVIVRRSGESSVIEAR